MSEIDIKIKDAPLSESINGNVKFPVSDGSNLPRAATFNQVHSFVKNGLKAEGEFALVAAIPTKTSQLTNDSKYATTSEIPTKVSQLENDAKYATTPVTDALAKSIAQNESDIERLIESHDTLGHAKALSLDMMSLPNVIGVPWFVIQDGVPTKAPVFVGQIYLDRTNKKVYFAFGVSSSSDWVVLN